MANVREKRRRLVQSVIFDGSEKKKTKLERDAEEEDKADQVQSQIDLTASQEKAMQESMTEIDNEMDILEANIDPFDMVSQRKKS